MDRSSRSGGSETVRRRRYKKKRNKFLPRLFAVLFVCLVVVLGYTAITAFIDGRNTNITFAIDSVEMMQDDAMPVFEAKATSKKPDDTVIDKETGLTVGALLAELNNPEIVKIVSDTDGTTEGEFPIVAEIPAELTAKMSDESLDKKVKLDTKEGTLTVKNKYGTWDGKQFKRYDGSLVTSDFIESRGDKYYFDENGALVSGFKVINDVEYHFNEDGKMTIGWIENEEGKWYANEDGSIHKGWLEVEGARYFMNEEDGKATVGTLTLGIRECEFDATGLLVNEKWLIDPNKPTVALTFDDGPGGRTAELIACLKKYNAHATFYMLGQCVPNYPETIPMMLEAGCELANHTYDHTYLSKVSPEEVQRQMRITDEEIIKAGGHETTTMRPPGGFVNDMMAENVGKPIIMWSIDTRDWEHRSTQQSIDIVSRQVTDGDIILMHDIHSPSIDAALQIIPMLVDRGFQLVTVSELAMVKEVQMQNGESYNSFY